MAQDGNTAGGNSYTIDNVTFPVGRTKLNSIFNAVRTTNIGSSAPDLVAGQFWIDNTTPSATVWTLYFFDGTDSISFATIDTTNNTVNFIDSTFTQLTSDLATNGNNINFGDNDKAQFGASQDLQIYHNGSNSIIKDAGTGDLRISGTNIYITNGADNEAKAYFGDNGPVELYYDNSKKLETTSTGVTVTGTVTADGLTVGTTADLQLLSNQDFTDNYNFGSAVGNTRKFSLISEQGSFNQALFFGDASSGSDSIFAISSSIDSGTTWNNRFRVNHSSEIVINDGGIDSDFRVESDTNTHALFVDGGSNTVLMAKSSVDNTTVGHRFNSDGFVSHVRSGNGVMRLNRTSNHGDILEIYKDGASVGSIGSDGVGTIDFNGTSVSTFSIGGSAQLVLHDGRLRPSADNDVDLGQTIATGGNDRRFKDLYLSGTVTNDGSGGMSIDTSGNVTFNESSIDADFRVEGNNNTHALFVRGSDDRVGIGSSAPQCALELANTDAEIVILDNNAFSSGVARTTKLNFKALNPNSAGTIESAGIHGVITPTTGYTFNEGYLSFYTRALAGSYTEKLRITGDGNVGIGTTSPTYPLSISSSYKGIQMNDGTSTLTIESNTAGQWINGVSGNNSFNVYTNGLQRLKIFGDGTTVINEASYDQDFRVESNSNTHMLFVDGGSNRIGINTSSPTRDIVFEPVLDGIMEMRSGGQIMFRPSGNANDHRITALSTGGLDVVWGGATLESLQRWGSNAVIINEQSYDHDFRVESNANTHALFVDGGGDDVCFFKSAIGDTVTGFDIRDNGNLTAVVNNASRVMKINNQGGNTYDAFLFHKSNVERGKVTVGDNITLTATSDLVFTNGDGDEIGFHRDDSFRPRTNDATHDFGTSSKRWKDLYLSGNIYLGGTGSANALDDYEEGTWTVSVTGTSTAGSFSSVNSSAHYTKVGRSVTVTFYFNGSSGTGSGNLNIGGLPFTSDSIEATTVLQYNGGLDLPTNTNTPCWRVPGGATSGTVRCNHDGTSNFVDMPYSATVSYARATLTYFTT